MIHELITRALDSTTFLPRENVVKNEKWFGLFFVGMICAHLSRILKPHNLRSAYYSTNTLYMNFCQLKDRIPRKKKVE